MSESIHITINGIPVEVEENTVILDAAKENQCGHSNTLLPPGYLCSRQLQGLFG